MEGYAKLANFMGRHDEYAIYRRFGRLNAQNLLYLQAELTHLEKELFYLAQRDSSIPEREYFSKDWWSLSQTEDDNDAEQWEKVLEIRRKLEEYNKTLMRQVEVAQLGTPSLYDLEFLRNWLVRPKMGNYPLLGIDRDSYQTENEIDLIAVKARSTPDVFSRWLTYYVIRKWHSAIGKKFKKPEQQNIGEGFGGYRDNILIVMARVATTVVASLLPICSVIALFYIDSDSIKLGVIVLASGFFALVLSLMTNARAIEVFAATAAYAAVNVVFLTNTREANT